MRKDNDKPGKPLNDLKSKSKPNEMSLHRRMVWGNIAAPVAEVFAFVKELHFLRRLWPAMETAKTLQVYNKHERLIYLSSKHYVGK